MLTLGRITQVEVLESRIAPASITFIDVDGMQVTVSSSKGSTADLEQVTILAAEGAGFELRELRLSDLPNVFQGAKISVVKGTLEDTQMVNVGFINATGLDLGKVTIDGDLGRILAGDENSVTAATKKLTVGSIGVQGLNTQDAGGTLISKFLGRLGSLVVKGDFKEASLTVLGVDPDPDENVSTSIDARGDIGDVLISGNFIGGASARTGFIYSKGSIGNITVTGSVLGGSGEFSASITSERTMGKVNVGGDVQGGLLVASNFSGRIFSGAGMGSVTVGGSLKGGDGMESANISTAGGLGNVTILGNIIGGAGMKSGAVGAEEQIGKITIGSTTGGGNITGGAGEQSGSILSGGSMKAVKVFGDIQGGDQMFAGSISSDGKIASVFVDGSITGGNGVESGAIGSSLALGAVNVMGNITGGAGNNSGNIASSKSIDSVNVQGWVKGGAGSQSGAIGCLTKLGPVTVGGDLLGGAGADSGTILGGQLIARVEITGSIKGVTDGTAGVGSAAVNSAGDVGVVIVHGDLIGGENNLSGSIRAGDKLARVVIDGNLAGAPSNVENSGVIRSLGSIASVKIGGDLIGGGGRYESSAEGLSVFGQIGCLGEIGSVSVVGNVLGGGGENSAQIFGGSINKVLINGDVTQGHAEKTASVIASKGDLGNLTINGTVTLKDNPAIEEGFRLQFSAGDSIGSVTFGNLNGTGDFSTGIISAVNTIGNVTVVNSAKFFQILAGYNPAGAPANSGAKINKVVIGTTGDGDMQGVDIVAGVLAEPFPGMGDGDFGTQDDTPINPFTSAVVSRIGSVIVKGTATPSTNANEHFGIVAGQILAVKIDGVAMPLTPRLDVIEIEPRAPSHYTIREVSFGLSGAERFS
jgi:hypothetical protein